MHGVTRALNCTTSDVGNLNASKSAIRVAEGEEEEEFEAADLLDVLSLGLRPMEDRWRRRTPKML